MMANTIIPLVHGLFISNSTDDYNLLIEKVLKQDNIQAELVMIDFKIGIIKFVGERSRNVLSKAVSSTRKN